MKGQPNDEYEGKREKSEEMVEGMEWNTWTRRNRTDTRDPIARSLQRSRAYIKNDSGRVLTRIGPVYSCIIVFLCYCVTPVPTNRSEYRPMLMKDSVPLDATSYTKETSLGHSRREWSIVILVKLQCSGGWRGHSTLSAKFRFIIRKAQAPQLHSRAGLPLQAYQSALGKHAES